MNSWKFIVAVVLLFVVVIAGSMIYGKLQQQETISYRYNGFEFAQAGSGSDLIWVTQIQVRGQVYNVPFYYHPTEVENVSFPEGLADKIVDNPVKPDAVYIALDPDGGAKPVIAGTEISYIMGKRYDLLNMNVQSALTRPDPNSAVDNLVVTCEDAVDGVLVIEFALGNESSISNTGNCVHVRYTDAEDSIRVADRFAYELLKIM